MDQTQNNNNNNNNNKKRNITQRNSRFLLPHNPTSAVSSSSTPPPQPSTNNNSITTNTTNNNNALQANTSNTSNTGLDLSNNTQTSSFNDEDFQMQESNNQHSVDTDFDSYWEEEARCPHRNRIRIGRQYQPSVPPLLKPGESDNRDLRNLETLTFCPKKSAQLSDSELDHYFTIAKSLNLFASLVETRSLLGRDVTIADLNHIRHKEGLSLASVIQPVRQSANVTNNQVNNNNNNTNNSSVLPSSQSQNKSPSNQTNCDSKLEPPTSSQSPSSSKSKEQKDNYQFNLPLMKALSHFINLHHPCHHDRDCKKLLKDVPLLDDSGPAVSITAGNLRQGNLAANKSSRSRNSAKQQVVKEEPASSDNRQSSEDHDGIQSPTFEEWTKEEVELFSKAIEVCGKNFSSIKKEFLPSKSVKSIVEYYYIGSRDVSDNKKKSNTIQQPPPVVETSDSCESPEKLLSTTISANNEAQQQQQQQQYQHQQGPNSDIGSTVGNKRANADPRMSVYNFDEDNSKDECGVVSNINQNQSSGAEIKPLKAKPILPNAPIDTNGANPNVGSLEFFMDGQLVLKLNACQDQQEGIDKCHWVQSGDKVATDRRQKKYTKRLSDKVSTPASTATPTPDSFQGELFDKVLFDQRR